MPSSRVARVSRRKTADHIPYPGVYRRKFRKSVVYYARFQIPKVVAVNLPNRAFANRLSLAKRTLHLGSYADPEVAAASVEMFVLNFVVEYPWTAIHVKDYLNSLGHLDYSHHTADSLLTYARTVVDDGLFTCTPAPTTTTTTTTIITTEEEEKEHQSWEVEEESTDSYFELEDYEFNIEEFVRD